MNTNVLFAIFKRNFVAYFTNPTGYVFVCVFVLLSSIAAFWPNEFFNANLANLDQLNKYLPFIMLIFIPAITMSVWAEERRLGTDELLLTIPAGDFDVVLGKYLAAVAIFSSALLYSSFCNLCVLFSLGGGFGGTDIGLFAGMYFGYWLVGAAMLSIGMVASFLTSNLTVGFVLGVLFNAPLVFFAYADAIPKIDLVANIVSRFSIAQQFADFGRGVVSLSSIFYFLMLTAVMLYLSMILIGRRHWRGGADGKSKLGHYAVRAVCLILIAFATTLILEWTAYRIDATAERLNTLLPQTRRIVNSLETDEPIQIEAFISKEVPESFVQQRLNVLSVLREFDAIGGNNIQLKVFDMGPTTVDEELRAEQQYGISPQTVQAVERGVQRQEEIFMGIVFRRGVNKVVIPFLARDLPAEYELVRSIQVVGRDASVPKPKVGVVITEAPMLVAGQANQKLIEELQKVYDVVPVSAKSPIAGDYKSLMVVQPSTLSKPELANVIAAIANGIPTAIFEDPFPVPDFWPAETQVGVLLGTMANSGGLPGMPPPQSPRGDMNDLWALLKVDVPAADVVWQSYNPIPKLSGLGVQREWVFVDRDMPADFSLRQGSPITEQLGRLLFLYPGHIDFQKSNLNFERLVGTSSSSGVLPSLGYYMQQNVGVNRYSPTPDAYTLAAHITGKPELPAGDAAAGGATGGIKDKKMNVVLVADLDFLHSALFNMREQDPSGELGLKFDNVPFVLNIIDVLSGEEGLIEIRRHGPRYHTLAALEERIAVASESTNQMVKSYTEQLEQDLQAERGKLQEEINKLDEDLAAGRIDAAAYKRTRQLIETRAENRFQIYQASRQREAEKDIRLVQRRLDQEVQSMQSTYKLFAVALPPLIPMIIGIAVFFNRRKREKLGVSAARIRQG